MMKISWSPNGSPDEYIITDLEVNAAQFAAALREKMYSSFEVYQIHDPLWKKATNDVCVRRERWDTTDGSFHDRLIDAILDLGIRHFEFHDYSL